VVKEKNIFFILHILCFINKNEKMKEKACKKDKANFQFPEIPITTIFIFLYFLLYSLKNKKPDPGVKGRVWKRGKKGGGIFY